MSVWDGHCRMRMSERRSNMRGIIAQRVSSILHADHIMVLEDGKMIGYGTHEELLEHCEVYREIRDSQM